MIQHLWLLIFRNRVIDPSRQWNFVHVDVPYSDVCLHKEHIKVLLVKGHGKEFFKQGSRH
jgi:hypothetical protein